MIQIEVAIITQPLQVEVTLNRVVGVLYSEIEEPFTLSTVDGNGKSTAQLTHVPVSGNYYLNGQRVRVGNGGRITSISAGGLITFDDDYTGFMFDAVYKY